MTKFVIEREIPDVGNMSLQEQKEAAQTTCNAMEEMGTEIQWQHSYVSGDRTFCIYIAASKEIIHEHAERSGFPVSNIFEVRTRLDPATAE